jgi:type III pantothenate kinase
VVPPVASRLEEALRRYLHVEPLAVGPGIKTGMPILYENPRDVGADRVVNSVAAYDKHRAGLIAVDFGTATTFDVVDEAGNYCGGAISPGINLSLEALHMAAAALPHVDVSKPARAIGTNTVACMQSGVYWGYIGLVEGIVREVRRERAAPMKVIATGGLASLFAQGTELFDAIEDDLTMHGLVLINAYNKETV